MSRLIWFVSWVVVAIWSLFCAVAYGLFDLVGGWMARNADAFSSDPQTVEWIFRLFSGLQSVSTAAVLVGWGAVSLMILGVPWLLDRMVGRAQVRTAPPPAWRGPGRDGVIDLAPDQYSVTPGPPGSPQAAAGGSAGTTPRIPRT